MLMQVKDDSHEDWLKIRGELKNICVKSYLYPRFEFFRLKFRLFQKRVLEIFKNEFYVFLLSRKM
jgi:hypothetical protein